MKTFGSFFSGGGLADIGAMSAGFKPIFAVEYDPANEKQSMRIADCYELNIGEHVIRKPVQEVYVTTLPKVAWFHSSPVCKNFSNAKANAEETDIDIVTAQAVVDYVNHHRPKFVTVENVIAYEASVAFSMIARCLLDNGYGFTVDRLMAADYGVPQTRLRMFCRAVLNNQPKPMTPTHEKEPNQRPNLFFRPKPKWIGWYEAVSDIAHTFPNTTFAPWQQKKLKEAGFSFNEIFVPHSHATSHTVGRSGGEPIYTVVAGKAPAQAFFPTTHSFGDTVGRAGDEPAQTITGEKKKYRAWVKDSFYLGNGERSNIKYSDAPTDVVTANHNMASLKSYIVEPRLGGDRPIQCLQGDRPAMTLTTASGGNVVRGFFAVNGSLNNFGQSMTVRNGERSIFTIVGSQDKKPIRVYYGRVATITARGLARFMSLPDWYELPAKKGDATTLLGNGVCSLLMQRIGEIW